MASPLHANGQAWPRAADNDGVALQRTRRDHETTYRDLIASDRAHLAILGCEVGGRWDPEALSILRQLAAAKAREAPSLIQRSTQMAWHRRWLSLLSVATQTSLAESLLQPSGPQRAEFDGCTPLCSEIRDDSPPAFCSRLPLRS